jgi:thiamine biosynthesis lipoprotein
MMNQRQVRLSTIAMATRFELVMYGEDEVYLRSIGEEALQEIERLDGQLSFYKADSEISFLNQFATKGFVKIDPRIFHLLKCCERLTVQTEGAFDITIAPLMRAWHFVREKGEIPTPTDLQNALGKVGMRHIEFDEQNFSIYFSQPGLEVDLGGFAKGYAVQQAVKLLRDLGVKSALLHGGTSSIATIGRPPKQSAWQIALQEPFQINHQPIIVSLADNCLSVSAIHGKFFDVEGKRFGHLFNPKTGEPVCNTLAACVIGADAAICEALSKAFMVHSFDWLPKFTEHFPEYESLLASADGNIFDSRKS